MPFIDPAFAKERKACDRSLRASLRRPPSGGSLPTPLWRLSLSRPPSGTSLLSPRRAYLRRHTMPKAWRGRPRSSAYPRRRA